MKILKCLGFLVMLGLFGLAAACDNTIRGVGQDVEDTGDAIEDAVE